jgi:hypothetical protein
VGEGAPHDGGEDHAREGEVVDVARLAGEELRVLLAGDRLADPGPGAFLGDCHLPSPQAAAALTALTMFW